MKYYKIKHSIDPKVVGGYIQASGSLKRGNIDNIGLRSKITIPVDPPILVLDKKSKPTTLLSSWIDYSVFLVVKDYFVQFLENFTIPDYQYWNIEVYHKKELIPIYQLFHISNPSDSDYIDYRKSDFYIIRRWDDTYTPKPVSIENHKQYLDLQNKLNDGNDFLEIEYKKLVMDFSTATEDIIRFVDVSLNFGYYISERLKNAIEKERFTGMEIVEIETLDDRIEVIY